MKIKLNKKVIAFTLVAILTTIFSLTWVQGSKASAATLGQALTNPEAGWKRIDDTDKAIVYDENWLQKVDAQHYNQTLTGAVTTKHSSFSFSFYGTKFRLVGAISTTYSDKVSVTVDGNTQYFSAYSTTFLPTCLLYEKTGLTNGVHSVKVTVVNTPSNSNGGFDYRLDALDIDSTGYFINSATTISLDKTSLALNIGDQPSLVATIKPYDATIKDVYWSSSDRDVVDVDDVTGKLIVKTAGTATITVKTTDGTNLTATCTITVAPPSNDRAILAITMVNGQIKEYDLPNTEISAFSNWFDGGHGKFGFTKTVQPYKEVKEYLAFDKISSYEVRTYPVSN
jgi:uncharacterized protein YjdB